MRAVHLIFVAAVLAFAPMALAQTDTQAAPADVTAEQPAEATASADVTTPAAPAEEGAPAEEATQAAEPERVCHTIERSESRLRSRRERVCRTQAEWDAQQRGANRSTEQPNNN